MSIIRYSLGEMDNNTYLIVDDATREGALVDPSFDSESLLPDILGRVSSLKYILNTHAHFDHVVGNAFYVENTEALLALHRLDLPLLRMLSEQGKMFGFELKPSPDPVIILDDGQIIQLGETSIQVLFTPGHAPGHVSFVVGGDLLCGDCIFQGSIGRTDLPGASLQTLMHSITTRLLTLPDETRVLPGHGAETTIGREKKSNPYIRD
jgi:glyoxylase-like metal-dependent hydrolase (beta-lactamase superfamily II)